MAKYKGGGSGKGGKSTKYTGRSREDNRASSKQIPQKKSFNKGGKQRGKFRGRRGNHKGSSDYRRPNNKSTKYTAPTMNSGSYSSMSISELNKLKRYNPKYPIAAMEAFSSYLLTLSQTIKNPHISSSIFRVEVNEDGIKKLIRKPITYITQEPNYNHIIIVKEQVATMTQQQIDAVNQDLQQKFEAEEAERLRIYNAEKDAAYREHRKRRILDGTAVTYARIDDGFEFPAFVPGVRAVFVQPATETAGTITIDGQIYPIRTKNLIPVPRTVAELLADGRKELADPYLKEIATVNKTIREHQVNDPADRMNAFGKAISLIEDAVLADVKAYVNRHHPNTVYDQWASRADVVELLNILEATQHPFYLDYQDEVSTKEMIRQLVLDLSKKDRYRRATETFSEFFDRYSKTKSYLDQAAVILQDEQVRIGEEQGVQELLVFMRPQGFEMEKKIDNLSLKNEARKKTVAEQINEFLRYCTADDEKIRRGILQQNSDGNDQQRKKNKTPNKPKDGNDEDSQGQNSSNSDQNRGTVDNNLLSMADMLKVDLPFERVKDGKDAGAEPSSSSSSSSSKPSYNPRGAAPKNVPFNRGNPGQFRTINTTGRNSSSQSSNQRTQSGSGGSYYNADPESEEYYYPEFEGLYLTLEENEPDIVLAASEPQQKRARTEPIVPLSTDPRVLIHDEGNNSSHVISNIDLLPLGIHDLDKTLVLKGQDRDWRTQYSKYGYNPCLGKCIYNETGNVNIINPNILVQDGWEETTFSDQYGIYAKIYKRKFNNSLEYTLEFVQNDQGHYVAIDPSLNPGFIFPDPSESASLGEISNLKKFLFNKTNERLRNYMAMKRAGERADFAIGRHRPLEINVQTGSQQQNERPIRRPRPKPSHK